MSMAASPLEQPALVLNRSWAPIYTVPAKRALVWLYRGVVQAVDDTNFTIHDFSSWCAVSALSEKPFIMTPNLHIVVPEVVKMVRYNGMPISRVAFTRKSLFQRDRYRCQYCGDTPGVKELTIDHVVPISRGGRSNWDNCVLACVPCNARKANRTPDEAHMTLLRKPDFPKWSPLHNVSRAKVLSSWQTFVSEAYWNTLLEE
jgi:5-methylcytosine-specific restriction endonuclease McrA